MYFCESIVVFYIRQAAQLCHPRNQCMSGEQPDIIPIQPCQFCVYLIPTMTLPVDLGRGVFHNLGSNLTLTLNASAGIKIISDAADTGETQRILQCLQSGEMWLTQAPEIKLHICISVEPGLIHPASAFFSQTGELVRRSKVSGTESFYLNY